MDWQLLHKHSLCCGSERFVGVGGLFRHAKDILTRNERAEYNRIKRFKKTAPVSAARLAAAMSCPGRAQAVSKWRRRGRLLLAIELKRSGVGEQLSSVHDNMAYADLTDR